jgi:hypothetical protein
MRCATKEDNRSQIRLTQLANAWLSYVFDKIQQKVTLWPQLGLLVRHDSRKTATILNEKISANEMQLSLVL